MTLAPNLIKKANIGAIIPSNIYVVEQSLFAVARKRSGSKVRPDQRTRTSYKFREKKFWKEWEEFYNKKTDTYWADEYPIEWSLTVRPILAHLYRAGIVAPFNAQPNPEVVLDTATAEKEPHRLEELDLFINYEDKNGNFPQDFPHRR
ncbi:hypothetical protein EDB82DRAFT_577428 [Fusarium venenatum]|nr:hypothetical protein EDB82DRAFT_577428 [Fusarium venenatum]